MNDGNDNPPPGWDNPSQEGTMTLVADDAAVFTDDKGHVIKFRLRPGATAFKRICS